MSKLALLTLHPQLTNKQKNVLKSKKDHTLIEGPYGTTKTYLALAKAMIALKNDEVEKIIVIRSPVSIRDIGFLPGTQDEKMEAFAGPYVGLIQQLSPKMNYRSLVNAKMIEFHPTSFLRGLTFDNSYVILDEFQSFNAHELDTAISRVGEGTRLILSGDSDQTDLKGREAEEHLDVVDALRRMKMDFDCFTFTEDDILRSEFVKRFYKARKAQATGESIAHAL
jgi:phosphate starvation-inducible protein PhoH and related proteins